MLTLYHGLASTCSKKVRMCLAEKGLAYESRLINLQKYEQHDPEYLKLNPKGVVPTLVHDGKPIVESTLIIEYLDEAFPDPPLHPPTAYGRHKMRLWTKWSDDVGYNAVYVPTWEKLSRPGVSRMDEASLGKMLSRVPTAERRKRWEQTARTGFSPEEFETAYGHMRNTFSYMEKALADGPWLAGGMFTLADIAIVPFVERILDLRPETREEVGGAPRLTDWYARMQARPSWQDAFFFQGMDASTSAVRKKIAEALGETAA
jgi:glutathione S-transferase